MNRGSGEPLAAILLMDASPAETVESIAAKVGLPLRARRADTLDGLAVAVAEPYDLLLSFGTSVIVPAAILGRAGSVAVNVHAASPAYPGRDPHHFAAYDGVDRYGATLHFMTATVDAGPIVDVEEVRVGEEPTPIGLLERARAASLRLIERTFARIRDGGLESLCADPTHSWGSRRYRRADLRALCRIDCAVDETEFRRRLRASAMPGYNNLTLELFGQVFRIEGADA